MSIRISVIIPAYNAAATIEATIRSVLEQSAPPYEVIVVNDASTDETERLLLELFRDRITYISLSHNGGPAHARNAGLAVATGSHIAFQDADDIWHLNKLEIVHHIVEHQPNVHFLYHPYTLAKVDFDLPIGGALRARPFSFAQLLLSNPIGTPCVVMKRGPGIQFNERMHYMEDYDLFLQVGYALGIYRLDIPLTQVGRPILSAGGQSDNRWRMRKGELIAYLRLPRLNLLFAFIVPFLMLLALGKHFIKSFRPPRSNY